MIQIEFSKAEQDALSYERYHHDYPRVRQKMEVLWLKSQGMTVSEISRLADVSPATAYRYIVDYQAGGVEQLKELNFRRPESELAAYKELLADHFRQEPTLSSPPSWDFSGPLLASSFKPLLADNASMCWAPWMPSPTNWLPLPMTLTSMPRVSVTCSSSCANSTLSYPSR